MSPTDDFLGMRPGSRRRRALQWLTVALAAVAVIVLVGRVVNGGEATRFFGMVQMLSDPTPLLGRSIAYERLVGSQLIQEDEPLQVHDDRDQPPPPPPPPPSLRAHPKAPYLRLVVSQESPAFMHFGSGDLLQKMFDVIGRWRAANSEENSRFV